MSTLSPILDVVIGLVGVYIAFSLLASWVQERVAAFLKLRSTGLVNGIYQMFDGNVTAFTQFVQDPMFQAMLSSGKNALPPPVMAKVSAANDTAAQVAQTAVDAAKKAAAAEQMIGDHLGFMKTIARTGPSYLSKEQFGAIFMNLVAQNGASDALMTASALLEPPPAGGGTSAPGSAPAATPADAAKNFAADVKTAADALGVGPQMNAILSQAGGDYDKFLAGIENWYDDHMDRVSGWYKRTSHAILVLIGLLLAIFFNIDSVRLYTGLSCSAALRSAAVIAAAKAPAGGSGSTADATFVTEMVNAVPLGWTQWPLTSDKTWQLPDQPVKCDTTTPPAVAAPPVDLKIYWLTKLLGFVITMFALSLGAPFWFDALSRLTNVRSAGNKPDTSRKKA
jgi:hypothetical protein